MVQGPTQQESGSKGGRYIFLGSRTSGEGRVLAVDYSKDMTAEEQKRYINYLAERVNAEESDRGKDEDDL